MSALATTTVTRTDSPFAKTFLFELKYDPKLTTASDIAVAVKEGVVTLSGYVSSYWEKDAAEKAVKRERSGKRHPGQTFHDAHRSRDRTRRGSGARKPHQHAIRQDKGHC
jgi:hypothetical protein